MIRMLICDDEPLISDGMCEIFSQDERLDVYCVYSSEEAMKILNKTRIDIVILDIQMPELSGLDVLAHIKKRWVFCQVIMLTGYSNFQYIYEATSFPDVKYILKSEGYNKVIQAVEDSIGNILNRISTQEILEKVKMQMIPMNNILKKDFLISILKGRSHASYSDNFEIDMELDIKNPVILMLCRPVDEKFTNPIKRNQQYYQLGNIIGMYLKSICFYEMIVCDNDLIYFFIQLKDSEQSEQTLLKGNLEIAQESCKKVMDITVSILIEINPISWDHLWKKNNQLLTLMNMQKDIDRAMYISEAVLPGKDDGIQGEYTDRGGGITFSGIEDLFNALNCGNDEDFFKIIHKLQASVSSMEDIHSLIGQECYYTVALSIMNYINKHNLGMRLTHETNLYKLTQIDSHKQWTEAFSYLEDLGRKIFKIRSDDATEKENKIIIHIKKHILQNLKSPDKTTLVYLSEMLYFNPSYLSRLFKQVTGETLTEYIIDCRIEVSKKMLLMTDAKIADIAEEVGYSIPANFTRIFKKIVGISPHEYRIDQVIDGDL